MSMSSSPSSPAFSHEEHIILAPLDHAAVVVRLETSSLLQQENATTPFSSVLRNLALEYDITRLLVKTGSISTNKAWNHHPLQDEWSAGPSGISILVELSNADDRFFALLKALVACRLVLAPLDAVTQPRLHRHIYRNDVSNESVVEFQVMLPLEGSTVASEGVKSFFGDEITSGILSSSNAKAVSHVLLGDSTEIPVLYKHRRSMWMDLERNCKNAEGRCSMSLRRGLEYGVRLTKTTRNKVSLSQLVPLSNLEACPFADSSRLVIKTPTKQTDENRFHEQVIEDWNAGTVLDLASFTPPQVSKDPYVYADRTLVRPHGVANVGRLLTRIQTKDLPCPLLHVAVVQVLPPYLAPLWDTWTPPLPPQLVRLRDGTMVVEYNVTLGSNQDFTVSLDYEPVLLPFQQFPADPNRGMELPPVVFRVSNCTHAIKQQLYSSPILLMPPVPDMSMPFNVISLTCTLYAFVIGSLANLLVRKSSDKVKKKLHPDQHKSKLQKLKEKLRDKISMFQKKKDAETSETPSKSKSDDDVAENEIPAKKDKDSAAS